MAKGGYIGVSSKAKKIKKIYIGVGGVAKKVKKAYIGVGGKAKLFYSGRSGVFASVTIGTNKSAKYDSESDTVSSFSVSSNNIYQLTYCKGKWVVALITGGMMYSYDLSTWTSISNVYSGNFTCFGLVSDDNNFYALVLNDSGSNYYGLGRIYVINASTMSATSYSGAGTSSAKSWSGPSNDVRLGILPNGTVQMNAQNGTYLFNPANPSTCTASGVSAHYMSQYYCPYARTSAKIGVLKQGSYLVFINDTSVVTSETQTSPQSIRISCKKIAFGNNIWLMYYNNQIYKSSDGVTWTATGTLPSYGVTSICYGDGLFVAASPSKKLLCLSEDGITWTEKTLSTFSSDASGLAFSRSRGFGDL